MKAERLNFVYHFDLPAIFGSQISFLKSITMGYAPSMEKEIKVQMVFSLKQLLDMIRQLPNEQKILLFNTLKEEFQKKGLVPSEDSIDLDELLDEEWENEFPDEDEYEMTDEEFNKAIEEMS